MLPLVDSSKLVAGGGIFDTHPEEGKEAQFQGSAIIYTGDTESEVRRLIQNDPYANAGVWDLERVQIIPVCLYS